MNAEEAASVDAFDPAATFRISRYSFITFGCTTLRKPQAAHFLHAQHGHTLVDRAHEAAYHA